MDITLSTEEFESKKLLADIGAEVSSLRSTLSNLRQEESSYLEQREERARKAIESFLDSSRDAVREIDSHKDSLSSFLSELQEYSKELISWDDKRKAHYANRDEEITLQENALNIWADELAGESAKIRSMKSIIDADRESVRRREQAVSNGERFVKDRTEMLIRTQERMNRDA